MARVQLSVILAITSFSVFLISAIMLRSGMTTMAFRYVLSIIAGYIIFLGLLRLWIWLQRRKENEDLSVEIESIDPSISDLNIGSTVVDNAFTFGGGGDFAGAGAGGSWTETDAPAMPAVGFIAPSNPTPSIVSSASSGSGGSGGFSFDADFDDGLALLAVIVIAVLIFGAVIYVVWIAPTLFAELLIDTAVVSSLYKPSRSIEREYWLKTALRKTAVPALIIMILFGSAGAIMQAAEPEAVTFGQFLKSV